MNQQKRPKGKNQFRNIAILSGIGIEMGVIIYLAAKGGIWLDHYYQTEKGIFTAAATLLGVAIAIYVVLLQLKRIQY
ncbi:AtpZ/AtpI family protein [Muriicola sp.]|uniref:AtpZ/AtpI family protein n=1 Tax=Muriicola sp. TaxID=2020856 RepID=UPI00356976C7